MAQDDAHGLELDFTDLAGNLQTAARELGATADPGPPRFAQLFLDAADVAAVKDVVVIDVEDGLMFDSRSVAGEVIRDEVDYAGVRATLTASLATARIALHIDVNFGDPVWPAPQRVVPGVQAWRACSMLIEVEIQRSLTGNRQAWRSAERELMPH